MPGSLWEHLAEARLVLVRAGIPAEDAALDADVLARRVLGCDRAALVTRARENPPPGFAREFELLVRRRAAREPVALITGHREFWGLEFEVSADTLVPRPETELIVELAAGTIDPSTSHAAADIGTGSGCLAVALALELPAAHVVATDISPGALALARRNALKHGVSRRISFLRGNLLDALSGPFDLIVSNPPYVPSGADLPPEVRCYEPAGALFAGDDGLSVLRALIAAARARLVPGGLFIVEFGFGQADAVRAMADGTGWRTVAVREDLQGIPRVAVLTR